VLACLRLMVEDPATLVEMNNLDMTLKSQLLTAVFKVSMGADPTVVDQAQDLMKVLLDSGADTYGISKEWGYAWGTVERLVHLENVATQGGRASANAGSMGPMSSLMGRRE
jgi:hypothetical protein